MAISIPIFTAQLNKSKYATDEANARAIYAELQADYLANSEVQTATVDNKTVTEGTAITVTITEQDGTENAYKFTGIVGVTITTGNDAKATTATTPSVSLAQCDKVKAEAVTFSNTTK